ncbi:MAG: PAS domain S-box protein, partial [Desulfatiglandaceae bacterium]
QLGWLPMEEAVKSEEHYRRLFETANDGIVLLEKGEGKITHANPATEKMLGYTGDDSIGKKLQDIGISLDLDDFQTTMENLEKNGIIKYDDVPAKTKAGQHIDTDIYLVDRARLVQCNIRDIANRKLVEKKLRESEEKYRLVVDNIADVITVMDLNLNLTYVSPSIIRLRGYTAEEAMGQTMEQIMTPESLQIITRVLEEEMRLEARGTADPDRTRILELEEYRKDGSIVWLENHMSALRDNEKKLIGFIALSRDITERKLAEEELDNEAAHRSILMEQSRDGIVILDQDGNVYESNKKFAEMLDYPLESMCKLNVTDWEFLYPPERLVEMIKSVDEKGAQFETKHRRRDGSIYDVEISTNAAWFAGQKLIFCVCRDITERKRAEEEREKLQSQLLQAQKMESIGRLAGGVAHDFNNMLSVIIGYAELDIDKTDSEDELHADLQEILGAARRSTDITRQLLTFARQQTIDPKVLNLNEAVESMLKMLRRLIGEDIDLSWEPGPELWPVKIDPTQLDQILANLCVNARDAIADVGKLTIETDTIRFYEEYCADHAGFLPGEYVLLTVSDDGCGMDRETLDKIFEPFFTTKDIGKGTGLGLAVIYGIVKQNEGFINVYSEPGKGTTFRLYFPRHAESTEQTEKYVAEEIPVGSGETVLIVEDEASILKLTKRILERFGYTVLEASGPEEAMVIAKEHSGGVHLLITDVVMPGMNGRELADKLQTDYPKLKVLFMSGYTADVIARHGILNPGVKFVQKPFSIEDLANKIRQALES